MKLNGGLKKRLEFYGALVVLGGGGYLYAMDKGGERSFVTDTKIEHVSGALVTHVERVEEVTALNREHYTEKLDDILDCLEEVEREIGLVKSLALAASDDPAKAQLLDGLIDMNVEMAILREQQTIALAALDSIASLVPDTVRVSLVVTRIDTVLTKEEKRKWYKLWLGR